MKSVKKLVLAAIVLPLTIGAASTFANDGKDHNSNRHGECGISMDRGIMRQLDLTDVQKEQLKKLKNANKAELKAKLDQDFEARKAERQAHHQQVQALLLADNFDQAAANKLAKEMAEKQSKRRVKMLEKKHQMLSVLTPEQKTKFIELQKQRRQECVDKAHKRLKKQKNK